MEVPVSSISFLIDDIRERLQEVTQKAEPGIIADITACYVAVIDELLALEVKKRDFRLAERSLITKLTDLRVKRCFQNARRGHFTHLPTLEAKITETMEKILITSATDLKSLRSIYVTHIEIMLSSQSTKVASLVDSFTPPVLELRGISPKDRFEATEIGDLNYLQQEIGKLWAWKRSEFVNELQDGFSALHIASRRGRLDVAKWLLDRGALATQPDKNGYHPIHWAAKDGHLAIVELLVKQHKAFLDARGEYGRTSLHMASYNFRQDMTALLLDFGADPNAKAEGDGHVTPLHEAVTKENSLGVALLLSCQKIDVKVASAWGHSPLFYAVAKGLPDIILMLVNHPSWSLPDDIMNLNHFNQLLRIQPEKNSDATKNLLIELWTKTSGVAPRPLAKSPYPVKNIDLIGDAKKYAQSLARNFDEVKEFTEKQMVDFLKELVTNLAKTKFPEDLIISYLEECLIHDTELKLSFAERAYFHFHLKKQQALLRQNVMEKWIKASFQITPVGESPNNGNHFLWSIVKALAKEKRIAKRALG